MAIEITKDIKNGSNYIAGYNDNILIFQSTSTETPVKAIVRVLDYEFEMSPNIDGLFYFNAKEIVTSLFGRFEDSYEYNSTLNDSNLITPLDFHLNIYLSNDDIETISIYDYWFTKAVRQIGAPYGTSMLDFENITLSPIPNIKLFKGFPFEYSKFNGNSITRYLVSSGSQSIINWIINSANTVDLCGVYLKWLNQQGAYSYWLFNKSYQEIVKHKGLKDILDNHDDIINALNTHSNIGKTGRKENTLYIDIKNEDSLLIESLLLSPEIYLYTNKKGSIATSKDWIKVKLLGGSTQTKNTKQGFSAIKIKIELPELFTQKL